MCGLLAVDCGFVVGLLGFIGRELICGLFEVYCVVLLGVGWEFI